MPVFSGFIMVRFFIQYNRHAVKTSYLSNHATSLLTLEHATPLLTSHFFKICNSASDRPIFKPAPSSLFLLYHHLFFIYLLYFFFHIISLACYLGAVLSAYRFPISLLYYLLAILTGLLLACNLICLSVFHKLILLLASNLDWLVASVQSCLLIGFLYNKPTCLLATSTASRYPIRQT